MIEYVNGINAIVSSAGMPIAGSRQSISPTLCHHEVADDDQRPAPSPPAGSTPAIGEKNIASEEQHADDHRGQAGAPALADARAALSM